MISLVAIVSGVLSVLLFGHDEKLLKKEDNDSFKYTCDYCRKNLHHFYFNNNDCKTISKALTDKVLQAELDYLQRSNCFEDSIQILINQHKITL